MSIRTQFESELNKVNQIFERKGNISTKDALSLAQSTILKEKQELFDRLNNTYFGGKAPFGMRLKLDDLGPNSINKIKKYLSADQASANVLFNLKVDGIGKGEIMMGYAVENLAIGGGSSDVDLNLFNESGKIIDTAELKEVTRQTSGKLVGWRTGKKWNGAKSRVWDELRKLYNLLKYSHKDLKAGTTSGDLIASKMLDGEASKFVAVAKDITELPPQFKKDFKVELGAEGELNVYTPSEELIGDINTEKGRKSLEKQFRQSINSNKIMTFSEIEAMAIKDWSSKKEQFVFLVKDKNDGFNDVVYLKNLKNNPKNMGLSSITQAPNGIKVWVKI